MSLADCLSKLVTPPLPLSASPQFSHFPFFFQRKSIRDSDGTSTLSVLQKSPRSTAISERDKRRKSRSGSPLVGVGFRKLKRIHAVLLKLSLFHKKYESLSLDLNISLPTLHITILFSSSSFLPSLLSFIH